jgi:succinate dehydrogenase/fumarate reductase flavoprotein subunit
MAGIDPGMFPLSRRETKAENRADLAATGRTQIEGASNRLHGLLKREGGEERLSEIRESIQALMERYVGIFRDGPGLLEALKEIRELKRRLGLAKVDDKGRAYNMEVVQALELDFMLELAETIAYSASIREESRGAHFRTDFQKRDDQKFLIHHLVTRTPSGPEAEKLAVTVTKWRPEERKY